MMNADFLSVPELRDYLKYNWDFPAQRLAPYRTQLLYRWALPAVCIVVVFFGGPMCDRLFAARSIGRCGDGHHLVFLAGSLEQLVCGSW